MYFSVEKVTVLISLLGFTRFTGLFHWHLLVEFKDYFIVILCSILMNNGYDIVITPLTLIV